MGYAKPFSSKPLAAPKPLPSLTQAQAKPPAPEPFAGTPAPPDTSGVNVPQGYKPPPPEPYVPPVKAPPTPSSYPVQTNAGGTGAKPTPGYGNVDFSSAPSYMVPILQTMWAKQTPLLQAELSRAQPYARDTYLYFASLDPSRMVVFNDTTMSANQAADQVMNGIRDARTKTEQNTAYANQQAANKAAQAKADALAAGLPVRPMPRVV